MYINRNSENMIREVSASFPCIVVYGPRQVGKSTTVDHLFGEQYRKVTLDDLDDRFDTSGDPVHSFESWSVQPGIELVS